MVAADSQIAGAGLFNQYIIFKIQKYLLQATHSAFNSKVKS